MVDVKQQLALAAVQAPMAPRRLKNKSATWFVAYLVACCVVLGIVASLVASHRADLLDLAMVYLLPEEWHFASKLLVDNFFAAQERLVVTNAAIVASLLVVQITLFPLKERVSLSLEQDNALTDDPIAEHPLWFQAWEEVKLFVAMLAAQGTIFWIGYSQNGGRRLLATVLSFVVLFASVGIDFLSPILQRHKLRYSVILKSLFAHPFLLFTFGALFSLPAIIAGAIAADHPTWSFGTQIGVVFGAQIVGIALAAIGGTIAAAPLVADAKARKPSHTIVRVLAWAALLGVVAWNTQRFAVVGTSLHHKTQVLKCRYEVDWKSFQGDLPGKAELIAAAKKGEITISGGFTVTITNPTSIDVEIEDNRLELRNKDKLVARTALPRIRVPAKSAATADVTFPLTIAVGQVFRIRELITTQGWSLTLYIEVTDGFEFPIYILTE
ncbi:MAG: LEA type 2 family protein [Kofleriaceae bacterium]